MHAHNLDRRIHFFQITPHAHNRAGCPHRCHKMGDLALRITPDFWASAVIVRQRIIRIGKLIKDHAAPFTLDLLCGITGAFHADFLGC